MAAERRARMRRAMFASDRNQVGFGTAYPVVDKIEAI
jgi:hypothetical protein